jgi:hypothetical protein
MRSGNTLSSLVKSYRHGDVRRNGAAAVEARPNVGLSRIPVVPRPGCKRQTLATTGLTSRPGVAESRDRQKRRGKPTGRS